MPALVSLGLRVASCQPMNRHTLHKIKRAPGPQDINRYGGRPIGIPTSGWPTIYNPETEAEQNMLHVLTLDTRDLGITRWDGALAVFASSTEMPLYFDDPTCDFEVVQISRAALAGGVHRAPSLPERPLKAGVLEVRPASSVSGMTFVGGRPRYIQSDDSGDDDFVLQLGDGFLPLNLGDSGALYVFESWAMWESC